MPAAVLRLPEACGPHDDRHHVGGAPSRLREADGELVLSEREARWRWSHGDLTNVAAAIVATATDSVAVGRICNVGEPGALPRAPWLRRVAEVAGLDTTIRTGPSNEQPEGFPFNWAHDMALDTRRTQTELKFAKEISHQQALVRSVLWERKA